MKYFLKIFVIILEPMEEAATEPVTEPTPAAKEEKMEEAAPTPVAAAAPVAAAVKSSPAKKVEESKPESPKKADAKPAEGTPKTKPTEGAPKTNEKRGTKRKRNDDEPYVVNEDEPEIPNDFMCLDWHNSDLTLKINKESFLAAEPFHSLAWGYIFSR